MTTACDEPISQDEKLFYEFFNTAMYARDPSKAVASLRCMNTLDRGSLNLLADLIDGSAQLHLVFARKLVFKKRGGVGRPQSATDMESVFELGGLTELFAAIASKDAAKLAHELRTIEKIAGSSLALFADLFEESKSLTRYFPWKLSFERHRAGRSEQPETINFGMTRLVQKAISQSEGKVESAIAEIQAEVIRINKRNAALTAAKPNSAILDRTRHIGESRTNARRIYRQYGPEKPKN